MSKLLNHKPREITVNVGEIQCSQKPAVFSCAGVGSCVVLFVYEASSAIGGVAHIMLPEFVETGTGTTRSHFADTSVNLLVTRLTALGARPERLRAKIVGGANLFQWANSTHMQGLGQNNIDTVKQELLRNRIYLAAEEVGGTIYKSVRCNPATGEVLIKTEGDLYKAI